MKRVERFVPLVLGLVVTAFILYGKPEEIVIPDVAPPREVVLERPTVSLPFPMRQSNWLGSQREGSCVYATMTSLLRWQGKPEFAEYWKSNYENGSWPERLSAEFDKEGIRYAYTTDDNVEFLEWALDTNRGCGMTVMGGIHMVALVHLDEEWAGVLDNNFTDEIKWIKREALVSEWKASRGWAVTPVYSPSPPLPQK